MFTRLHQDSVGLERIERPWGEFIILSTVKDKNDLIHKQKLLIIKPNTTMQLHKHVDYAELWIGEDEFDYVVESEGGDLTVTTAAPFERVFVPKKRKHQIITKDKEVRIFEIQVGVIVDEDNIKFD